VNSGRTAYSVLACTKLAGLDHRNHVTGARLDRLGDVSAVRSHTWTTRANGVVTTHSTNSIARVTIGRATVKGVTATTRAWHDGSGFHASARTSVASITGPGGQSLPLPTPGNSTVIPGIARISVGSNATGRDRAYAAAQAIALRITVIPTGTKVIAGYAGSRIDGDVTGGLFHGFANGSQVHVLGHTATSGRTSLLPISCPGTRGAVETTGTLTHTNSLGASLSGLNSSVYGVQHRASADGFTRARVAKATLFNSRLKISGVVARANVTLQGDGTHVRTDQGTRLGGIFLNGNRVRVGSDGAVRVAGLALIHTDVVTRSANGIDVVGVRVKLLSGAHKGSVIDLAHATLTITDK
jgi:hypothetical protein